jgi:stage V sporulation protein B
MLYCDAITDAMTKGLGQQKICVRYNILTSAMDVVFLYLLLPTYGMQGYFFSFLVTHLLNFILSLRRLMKITHMKLPLQIPAAGAVCAVCGVWVVSHLVSPVLQAVLYSVILMCLLYLGKIIRSEDVRWIKGLVHKK